MSTPELRGDPAWAWAVYEPSPDDPWNLPRVAHLHRRAGFAPPWPVLERDLAAGPASSIDRLLDGEAATAAGQAASLFAEEHDALAQRFAGGASLTRLQGIWLRRMIDAPHPLLERMTLFWHGHFATSNAKVNDTAMMARQNALIRRHALGDFTTLLSAMARDPAMLVWLDATVSRKAHPNENYAREVMELFTLGRGWYTEQDVREAARAFTGGFLQGREFRDVPAQHDDGVKTILGRSGRFRGDDVASILLGQPACAEFLCRKLFRHFVTEVDPPSPALVAPLADAFRSSGYDIKTPIRMILRSRLFHDDSVRRKRIKSPIELAVGTIRSLEVLKPTVAADPLAESCARMGQSLFAPPSVAGWDGGPAWINTTTSLARSNFVLGLLADTARFRAESFAARADPARFYIDLLVQDALDAPVRNQIRGTPQDIAQAILTSPEYQLA